MIDKALQAFLVEFRLDGPDDTEKLPEPEQGHNAWLAAGEVIERIKQDIEARKRRSNNED